MNKKYQTEIDIFGQNNRTFEDDLVEVEYWDGGLQEQEIAAIEKIRSAFSGKKEISRDSARGGTLKDQLGSLGLGRNSIFPWKGYAGFRFVDYKKT